MPASDQRHCHYGRRSFLLLSPNDAKPGISYLSTFRHLLSFLSNPSRQVKVTVVKTAKARAGVDPHFFYLLFTPFFPNRKNYIASQRFDFRNRIRKNKKGGTFLDPTSGFFSLAGITQRPVLQEKGPPQGRGS